MKLVGHFSEQVVSVLNLNIVPGTPIYIGERNTMHIKVRHPVEYELYYSRITEILANPDYVHNNSKNSSVDFIKLFQMGDDCIQVSVRIDAKGTHYVRTLFQLMSYKFERYVENGELIKIS